MSDQAAQLAQVRRHWEHIGTDPDISHEMYHDDAVLEFPSRENVSKASPTSRNGAASTRPRCNTGSDV